MINANVVLSRGQLLDAVWGTDFYGDDSVVADLHLLPAAQDRHPRTDPPAVHAPWLRLRAARHPAVRRRPLIRIRPENDCDLARRRPTARTGPPRLVLAYPVVVARPADRAVPAGRHLALAVVDIVLPTVVSSTLTTSRDLSLRVMLNSLAGAGPDVAEQMRSTSPFKGGVGITLV